MYAVYKFLPRGSACRATVDPADGRHGLPRDCVRVGIAVVSQESAGGRATRHTLVIYDTDAADKGYPPNTLGGRQPAAKTPYCGTVIVAAIVENEGTETFVDVTADDLEHAGCR